MIIEFREGHPLTDEEISKFMRWFKGASPMSIPVNYLQLTDKGQVQMLSWQCPVCGVGVRGDIEVCPNCVKRAGGAKVTIQEDELSTVRNFLGRWGYEVDVSSANGKIRDVKVVEAKSIIE